MRYLVRLALVLLLVSCAPTSSSASPKHDKRGAVYPQKHWERLKRPEVNGWSSEKLQTAKNFAKSIGSMSWLLVEDGIIVDSYGDIQKINSLHSARKSLMSTMYGLAVNDGKIELGSTLGQLGIDEI